jgi:hypothetical protein
VAASYWYGVGFVIPGGAGTGPPVTGGLATAGWFGAEADRTSYVDAERATNAAAAAITRPPTTTSRTVPELVSSLLPASRFCCFNRSSRRSPSRRSTRTLFDRF